MRTNEIAKGRIQELSTLQKASVLEKMKFVSNCKENSTTNSASGVLLKMSGKKKNIHLNYTFVCVEKCISFIIILKKSSSKRTNETLSLGTSLLRVLYRWENNQKEWHYPCGSKWLRSKVYWACMETCKRLCEWSNSFGPYPIYFIPLFDPRTFDLHSPISALFFFFFFSFYFLHWLERVFYFVVLYWWNNFSSRFSAAFSFNFYVREAITQSFSVSALFARITFKYIFRTFFYF